MVSKKPLVGVGTPVSIQRSEWIKKFPGGRGGNNCPSFYYLRDGIGCLFRCSYCYLKRFEGDYFRHDAGAEINPRIGDMLERVDQFLKRKTPAALILGEVTDAWGWSHIELVDPADGRKWTGRERNLELIRRFGAQDRMTLITLTKSGKVHRVLDGVAPNPRVILSWSVNAMDVGAMYEMGTDQALSRFTDAAICRGLGWRVRLRLDPMIPIKGWRRVYEQALDLITLTVRPEQVTVGSWRPRNIDPMFRSARETDPELFAMLEPDGGEDGRFRLANRLEMYRWAFSRLQGHVPEISLCKEDLDLQETIYPEFGIGCQACNCLGSPVDRVRPSTMDV